jgi:hypothetical protein
LRLSYSGNLKARSKHNTGSLGTLGHCVWVGDDNARGAWTGVGSDVNLLRSLNNVELTVKGVAVSAPPPIT